MKIQQQIEKYLSKFFDKDRIIRDKDNFINILDNTSVYAWGMAEPMSYDGYRIVILDCSPLKKGLKGNVFYDYITEKKYQKLVQNRSLYIDGIGILVYRLNNYYIGEKWITTEYLAYQTLEKRIKIIDAMNKLKRKMRKMAFYSIK